MTHKFKGSNHDLVVQSTTFVGCSCHWMTPYEWSTPADAVLAFMDRHIKFASDSVGDGWDFWAPKPEDLEWTKKTLESLKDGGVWGIPYSGAIVKVYKSKQAIQYESVGDNEVLVQRTNTIVTLLGWDVYECHQRIPA